MGTFSLSIPSWEQTQLQQLSTSNELSGISPVIIGAIDQAESSGDPGTPNGAGYGGYFGLSPTATYPGGNIVGGGEGTNTPAEFDKEAEIAAAEFASLLGGVGDDAVQAEYHYQQGGNAAPETDAALESGNFGDGPPLVYEALGGNATTTGGTPDSTDVSGSTSKAQGGTGSSSTSIQLKGVGAVLQTLDTVMNPGSGGTILNLLTLGGADVATQVEGLVVRGMFVLGFLGVTYFGFKAITTSSPNPAGPGLVTEFSNAVQGQQRQGNASRALDQSAARINQGAARLSNSTMDLSLSQQRTSQAQQRADTAAARERRLSASREAQSTSNGIVASTEAAIETVGEAGAL